LKHTAAFYELCSVHTDFFGSVSRSYKSFLFVLTKTVKNLGVFMN